MLTIMLEFDKENAASKLRDIINGYKDPIRGMADSSNIDGAHYLLTFNNPINPLSSYAWVGVKYYPTREELVFIVNGTPKVEGIVQNDLPPDFMDFISGQFPGSLYELSSPHYHKWSKVRLDNP